MFLLLTGVQTNAQTQTSVIGYVQDDRFHPLLVVEAAQIGPYDARKTSLLGVLRNAFEETGAEFPIQRDVEKPGPDGEPARYGLVPGRSDEAAFFELNRGRNPRRVSRPTPELTQSFLRYFAPDESEETELRMLYVTDLDSDGKKELWMSYRSLGGKIGRMVWEQRASKGEWIELAHHCYAYD